MPGRTVCPDSSYRVLALIQLVANSVLGSSGTGREVDVGVLGDVLVGLLGGTRGSLEERGQWGSA
jgi:hypothetical protein